MTTDPDPTPPEPGVGPLTPGALLAIGAEVLVTAGAGVYTAAGVVGLAAAGVAGAGGTAIATYARRGHRTSASRGPTQTPGRSTRATRAGRPAGPAPTRAGSTAGRPRATPGRTATAPAGRSAGRPAGSAPARTGSTRRPSLFASRQPAASGTSRRRGGLRLPTLGLSLPGRRHRSGRPGSTPARGHGSTSTRAAGRPRRAAGRLAQLGRRVASAPTRRTTRPAPAPTGRVRPHVQAPPGVAARPPTRLARTRAAGRPHARPAPAIPPPDPTRRPAVTTPDPYRSPHGWAPAQLLAEAADAMTRYEPDHMEDYIGHLGQLPAMAGNFQLMIRRLAEKTEKELPAAGAVSALLHDMARAVSAVQGAAEEVAPGARRAHREDIERLENPRNGVQAEKKWNAR
ncbi:hypothetical protein MXD62_19860 [Frankia sp. Mgl5]|uniref:hypothetical protein n=1 Tax=Frankia sp. Mgl5 TaxID=2933793 RepID=UPI00200E70AB|nr:hypothetical protein [Frankia sp. Mgl5]MCK9929407.1 hypothetical protein [Frankia sp. Mgl5]